MTLSLILLAIGMIALFFEVFVPGAVLGILGALLIGASVVFSYMELGPAGGSGFLVAAFLLVVIELIIALYVLPKTSFAKRLMLQSSINGTASEDKRYLIGAQGVAVTDLRPSGMVQIGRERVDVVADCEFIAQGSNVCVAAVEGFKIIVKQVVQERS